MTVEEHRLLIEILRTNHGVGTHLEIGTAAGGTLCAMLKAFPATARPRFAVVDTMRYFPRQLEVVKQNLTQHGFDPEQIDIRITKSEVAFRRAEEARETFDFVLIDGSHKIRAVMSDLKWTRLVTVGGLVCLHDYSTRFLGVKMAVDRFLSRNPTYERIGLSGSLLGLRKVAMATQPEISRGDEFYASVLDLLLRLRTKLTRGFERQER
jgi:predicted O-methyltransferase YrrM